MEMLKFLELKDIDYKVGEIRTFFKNGVSAMLEERRDEKLEQIMVRIQTRARGYLARKRLKNKAFQERVIKILKKNVNICLKCRQWQWWILSNCIKPLLAMRVHEEAMQAAQTQCLSLEKEKENLLETNKNLKVDFDNLKNSWSRIPLNFTRLKRGIQRGICGGSNKKKRNEHGADIFLV